MLSTRESEVLSLASEGLTDKEIAKALQVKFRTIRTYWERILLKLNAVSRLHAYAIWHRNQP